MSTTIAIFDLDGTITRRDTYVAYLLHVLRRRPANILGCFGLPLTAMQFKLGRITNDQVKSAFLKRVMDNCTRSEVERYTADFLARRFSKLAKPKALARIAWHRQQGHRLLLATASFDFYADAIGQSLGFDHVIATRAIWRHEKITGDFEGENLRAEAKLRAVRRVINRIDTEIAWIVAYSDNQSDLPILRFADHGIAVDPTPALAAAAQAYGLDIEIWNRKPEAISRSDTGPQLRIQAATLKNVGGGK